MEILSSCRICLTRGVRMHMIFNTYLQETFEQLTNLPFQREDGRPLLICYICKARLKNCYNMRVNCLRSEEYFTDLLNNHIKPMPLQCVNKLQIVHPIICFNYGSVGMKGPDNVVVLCDDDLRPSPIETSDVQVKEENSEEDNTIDEADSIVYTEAEDIFKTEDESREDDEIVHIVEANVNIDLDADEQNLDDSLEPDYNAQTVKFKDLCPRTVKVVLNRINLEGIETSVLITEKLKLPAVKESQSTTSSNHQTEVRFAPNKNVKKIHPVKKTNQGIDKDIGRNTSAIVTEIMDTSGELLTSSPLGDLWIYAKTYIHTGEKPYRCDLCYKRFNYRCHLVRHTQIHSGKKPYRCDICEKRYTQKGDLVRHTRIHTGEKPYICDICDKRFIQKSDLVRHTRVHTGEKPYKCNICEKGFCSKSKLTFHTRLHTGEKPYRCDLCYKRFSCKWHLVRHVQIHSGKKPYRCDICDMRYTYKGDLVKHTRIHNGEKRYICDICDKSFGCKTSILKHTIIHTGKKPYRCDACEKSFFSKSGLTLHTRLHTGEKPFRCDMCYKRFNYKWHLVRHTQIHSDKKTIQV